MIGTVNFEVGQSLLRTMLPYGKSLARDPDSFFPAAWPNVMERRFYDGHDRKVDGSTSTQASLLLPWIRCFMTIISAWWYLTSNKLRKSEAKFKRKTRKQVQLLS